MPSLSILVQAQNVFAQSNSVNKKISDKSISHTTGNNASQRISQTFQRMTDRKNCRLVLKIFILRLINQKQKRRTSLLLGIR